MKASQNLLQETLEREHVSHADPKVPKQFYLKDYSSFLEEFSFFLGRAAVLPNTSLKLRSVVSCTRSHAKPYIAPTLACFASSLTKRQRGPRPSKTPRYRNIFILVDGVPKKAEFGVELDIADKLCSLLQPQFNVFLKNLADECRVLPTDIHASEHFLEKTRELISAAKDCEVFIALGSGTLTDLLKHALYTSGPADKERIFISIPTAMTVTAFSSSFSIIDIAGVKRTRPSQNIAATFWIEPLLQAAPMNLSRAGYGDLLAYFVAQADWYLAFKLGLSEKYDELSYRLMSPFAEGLKKAAKNFSDAASFKNVIVDLVPMLAMAGIAMSLTGETTPLSGYEHAISHALDFLRLNSHQELLLHGHQVALGALSSAICYDQLLSKESSELKIKEPLTQDELSQIFAKLVPNNEEAKAIFLKDYLVKHEKWFLVKEKFPSFLKEWPEIKKRLYQLTIRSRELKDILIKSHLPIQPSETHPEITEEEYEQAVRLAPFVRTRFCLGDFLLWLGRALE